MSKKTLLTTAAFIAAFFVSQAEAQIRMQFVPMSMACGPHQDLLRVVRNYHKEVLIGRALTHDGGLTELFVGPKGEWTFMVTPNPNQITCVLMSGEHWQILDGQTDGDGEDSAEW